MNANFYLNKLASSKILNLIRFNDINFRYLKISVTDLSINKTTCVNKSTQWFEIYKKKQQQQVGRYKQIVCLQTKSNI